MKLSEKQQEMLTFIEDFVATNNYPPTYEEIRAGLNISAKSLVHYHLNILEEAALLSRSPNTPRSIRLLGDRGTFRVPVANQAEDEAIALTRDIVSEDDNLYALKVEGDALLDDLINDGDVVVIQRQSQVQNGEMVALRLVDQDQTTIKRYYRENGHVRLESAHPQREARLVKPETVEIQGKVMAVIRKVD